MKDKAIYHAWKRMRERCLSKSSEKYQYYGARGIKICKDWNFFSLFYRDMQASWQPGLTLDRIDVNGNYEPANCRWITQAEQNRNTRRITISDAEILQMREEIKLPGMTQAKLAEKYGCPKRSISNFINGTTRAYVASLAESEAAEGMESTGEGKVSTSPYALHAPVDATQTTASPNHS